MKYRVTQDILCVRMLGYNSSGFGCQFFKGDNFMIVANSSVVPRRPSKVMG